MRPGAKTPPPRDSWADALEEAEPWRDATPEQHYAGLEQACALAFAVLEGHPRRDEFLAWQDPLPADSIALIEHLIAEARGRSSP
jgi:hypothetical protein